MRDTKRTAANMLHNTESVALGITSLDIFLETLIWEKLEIGADHFCNFLKSMLKTNFFFPSVLTSKCVNRKKKCSSNHDQSDEAALARGPLTTGCVMSCRRKFSKYEFRFDSRSSL